MDILIDFCLIVRHALAALRAGVCRFFCQKIAKGVNKLMWSGCCNPPLIQLGLDGKGEALIEPGWVLLGTRRAELTVVGSAEEVYGGSHRSWFFAEG